MQMRISRMSRRAYELPSFLSIVRRSKCDDPPGSVSGDRLEADLALLLAVPVVHPAGGDADQDQARRVRAFGEPAVERLVPVLGEAGLVADQRGLALDVDEHAGLADDAQKPGAAEV